MTWKKVEKQAWNKSPLEDPIFSDKIELEYSSDTRAFGKQSAGRRSTREAPRTLWRKILFAGHVVSEEIEFRRATVQPTVLQPSFLENEVPTGKIHLCVQIPFTLFVQNKLRVFSCDFSGRTDVERDGFIPYVSRAFSPCTISRFPPAPPIASRPVYR